MDALAANISAILTLVGVLAGAGLQHYLTRSTERRRQFDALRRDAYVEYLSAVANFAQASATNQNRMNCLADAANAKTRMCIYGSEQIVRMLEEFERQGPTLANDESAAIFLKLVAQMRTEGVGSSAVVSNSDLKASILGLRR